MTFSVRKPFHVAVLLALGAGTLRAADYYVNRKTGDDAFDGRSETVAAAPRGPFRTIVKAIRSARPGDTVFLDPGAGPYHESVLFYDHPAWYHAGGEPGKPLTLDGRGATVTGADPCPPEGWQPWRGRVFCRDDFPTTGGLMVDGARVGGISPVAMLEPGDWFYFPAFKHLYWRPASAPTGEERLLYADSEPVTVDAKRWGPAGAPGVVRLVGVPPPTALERDGKPQAAVTLKERLKPGQWVREEGRLYYHLPAGKSFADLDIACVVRQNGVQIGGSTAHVVVRNLHTTRFYNDGYNIHGGAHHIRFENITATYCFDEGYSAHSDTDCEIDGATLLFNASGLTNVMRARTKARNLLIAFSDGIGYAGLDQAVEDVANLILIDNGAQLGGGRLSASNVLALVTADNKGSMQFGGETTLDRLTVVGPHSVRLNAAAALSLRNSVFAGGAEWHIRADDPEKRLPAVTRLTLDPETPLTYGGRYPWTALPLAAWLEERFPGETVPLAAPPRLAADGALSGLPAATGCTPELLEKAAVFLRSHPGRWRPCGNPCP